MDPRLVVKLLAFLWWFLVDLSCGMDCEIRYSATNWTPSSHFKAGLMSLMKAESQYEGRWQSKENRSLKYLVDAETMEEVCHVVEQEHHHDTGPGPGPDNVIQMEDCKDCIKEHDVQKRNAEAAALDNENMASQNGTDIDIQDPFLAFLRDFFMHFDIKGVNIIIHISDLRGMLLIST